MYGKTEDLSWSSGEQRQVPPITLHSPRKRQGLAGWQSCIPTRKVRKEAAAVYSATCCSEPIVLLTDLEGSCLVMPHGCL
jgi:hypothetical protein